MNKFISGRIKSLGYAFKGAYLLLKTEHAVITQALLGLLFIFLGLYFHINRIEWILQLFAIGLVLSVESLNTGIEKLCDFVHPQYHNKIGFIKDISAGAVTFAVLFSIIISLLIYYPYLF